MSLTESTMLELGSTLPEFNLLSTDEQWISHESFSGSHLLVVIFMCNHCPYVIHIAPALSRLAQSYDVSEVAFVGINSNDVQAYPADNFENMKAEKAQRDYNFPYLLDESQEVAKAFGAACTPDIYVFDQSRKLVYRGQFDDTRPHRISSGNYDDRDGAASGKDLKVALDTLLNGKTLSDQQIPSMGCNIKWKPGNEPDYYG